MARLSVLWVLGVPMVARTWETENAGRPINLQGSRSHLGDSIATFMAMLIPYLAYSGHRSLQLATKVRLSLLYLPSSIFLPS